MAAGKIETGKYDLFHNLHLQMQQVQSSFLFQELIQFTSSLR